MDYSLELEMSALNVLGKFYFWGNYFGWTLK